MKQGILIFSLDFELYWGLVGRKSLEEYRETLLGGRRAIPALLNLFKRYEIHATWATVGFLFCRSRQALLDAVPGLIPQYENASLSPYAHLAQIGENEETDPFHFAPSLIQCIAKYENQEIATHTFSHYYAQAGGQTRETFAADLKAARQVALESGYLVKSLVFPRNQENIQYLDLCRENGIICFRGITNSLSYRATDVAGSGRRRGLRFMDSYFNLLGHHTYPLDAVARHVPCNLPASRFLRAYSARLANLEPLRLKRILDDITFAAENGLVYHLWWHPENFGCHPAENLQFLEAILIHYSKLRSRFGLQSRTMQETAELIIENY